MSLLDSVRAEQEDRDNTCSVFIARSKLALEKQSEFDEAINSQYRASIVVKVLKLEWNLQLSPDAITRHRHDECRCLPQQRESSI